MLHICHQILLPWSPSLMDGLLNYAKGQEIFMSLLGPHPHPSEGVGRSFRAGEIYKVFEGTIFLPFPAASFSSAPQRTGQLAPAVCAGGGGRQGRGENNGVGGGQAPPASLHQLCTASCCPLRGSPFLLSSVWGRIAKLWMLATCLSQPPPSIPLPTFSQVPCSCDRRRRGHFSSLT